LFKLDLSDQIAHFMKYISIAFLLLFLTTTKCVVANPVITFNHPSKKIQLDNNNTYLIADPNHSFTINQILADTFRTIYSEDMPNLGLSNNIYWAKFNLTNSTSQKLILKFNQPLLNNITLYRIDHKDTSQTTFSEKNPFIERQYYYATYAFDLNVNTEDTITYVLKFNSNEPIIFDVKIADADVIAKAELQEEIITGIYIGILFVMIFYNLFIYFTIRDRSYLIYVCYIIFIGLAQISVPGYGFKYLWPDFPAFNDLSIILFASIASIFGVEFLKIFLKTKQHTPLFNKYLLGFEAVFVSILIIYFTGNNILAFLILQLATFLLCIFIIITAIRIIYIGYRPAIFFLIAWIVLLLSGCIFIAKDFGLLPYNFLTIHIMQIGSGIEVIFLSFALADKINILKKEKETSQALALEALLQNELIIRNQNTLLENKVEERTKELKEINNELSVTISDLKQTQSQLISSEKMASLGHLTAGIAHEINNPINFVISNVKPLKKDIEDIYELIRKYENLDPINDLQNKIAEINSFRNQINYKYLKNEIGSLLKEIEDRAGKTADIVHGLTAYSKVDENDFKRADIIEVLNSSLTLLNQEITGAEIELIRNFSPLPQIECFPGKLNQVFMNIINNSIHAIKENTGHKKGQIIITTTYDNYKIHLSIKDNGIGMTEETKGKIFKPFFSTKEIGKGAGLGMSIAFSIITEHNGNIQLLSEYGKGSECIISLPINYTSK